MVRDRVAQVREIMAREGIDCVIYTDKDPHQSEYSGKRYKKRSYISGFTGSNGIVAITLDSGAMWTDGRYYIQAEKELNGSGLDMMKMESSCDNIYQWIKKRFEGTDKLKFGVDSWCFTLSDRERLSKELKDIEIIFSDIDPLDEVWSDREDLKLSNPILLDIEYSGKSATDKISLVAETLKDNQAYLVTTLDDIAYLTNLRGSDIKYSPVNYAYLLITKQDRKLFLSSNEDISSYLQAQEITLYSYNDLEDQLSELKDLELLTQNYNLSIKLGDTLDESVKIVDSPNLVEKMKGVKNEIEIGNSRDAFVSEAISLVKLQIWLENIDKSVTESEVAEQLKQFRREDPKYVDDSFETIAAFGKNGAMMHYSSYKNEGVKVEKEGFFLLDTGGNYLNGTSDITRTFVMGELSDEMKNHYTLVLKSHIRLANAIFLKGSTAHALDCLAREPIWRYLLDYKCGTGHGVGFFLNVHEGPQNFSQHPDHVKMEKGMITTIEPGIYLEDQYGIRIENLYLTVDAGESEFGEFYKFEPLNFNPIDRRAIVKDMLDSLEIEWLNSYHKKCYDLLSPKLDEDEKVWLKYMTEPI